MKTRPKKKCTLTEQGLESSLFAMLEFGYKACERGDNIQKATLDVTPVIEKFVSDCGLEKEILRIKGLKP